MTRAGITTATILDPLPGSFVSWLVTRPNVSVSGPRPPIGLALHFAWDHVTDQYEALFVRMVRPRSGRRPTSQ